MGTPDLKDREDHIEVKQANHDNGLLQIDMDRKIPEAMKLRKIEIGSGNPSSKPMKSLNAAWEKADMGAILPHARIAPVADSWFHTFAIGLSRFLGTERPADALESLVTFGGVAYKWPADRAIDRALAQKKAAACPDQASLR